MSHLNTCPKFGVHFILQTNNLHIAIAQTGGVNLTLKSLKDSPATVKGKVRFIVATDGADFEAEDIDTGETIACAFQDFPDHFGFFLPLAGISTVKQIRESSFDIRATSRLNRLYIELLKDNPEWGTAERRHEMNHLMARRHQTKAKREQLYECKKKYPISFRFLRTQRQVI